jgi:ribosomal protein S18 acetylase RimI-like enzyme
MAVNISIRRYRSEDYPELSSLWEETGVGRPERGDNHQTITDSISLGGALFVMTDSEDHIIGSSWMTFDGRRIYLHHFAILPAHQGKGLSKPLLAESLKFARDKGYQVKLEVHRSNNKAIELYTEAGFRYLGDYDVYIIRDLNEIL